MMEIRSYRRVFDLERRIYSIDSLRLNPAGVPVRGILYFVVILTVVVIAATLPLIAPVARSVPWYLRDLALPGAMATLLGMLRVEGRTFHVAGLALLRFWLEPRQLMCLRGCEPFGGRWYPQEILMIPDGSDEGMRGMRYTGPGAVRVTLEHERTDRARAVGSVVRRMAGGGWCAPLSLKEIPGRQRLERDQVILLGEGARMVVRSSGTRRR